MKRTTTTIGVQVTWTKDELRKAAGIPSNARATMRVGDCAHGLGDLTIEWEVVNVRESTAIKVPSVGA